MPLNKSTGNMYPWVTHTWNPIRGRCHHECSYCYMKGKVLGEPRFIESELKTSLGINKKIFVGSSIDIWAVEIPEAWIAETLRKCRKNPSSQYLFQTKNPKRMYEFMEAFPDDTILGITLESNRDYPSISKAPEIEDRVGWIEDLRHLDFTAMVSIEPILEFDLGEFINQITRCAPLFVSIGADSKGHHLPEPTAGKTRDLIEALREFTEVRIKDNVSRIVGGDWVRSIKIERPPIGRIERDGLS